MMGRLILALSLLLLSDTIICQNISVKSFRKLENDLSARVHAAKRDQNGDVCAIIKIVTTQTNFDFEGDGHGVVDVAYKVGEIWLYVPYGVKRLTIKHPQLGVYRDYNYPLPIEKATTYELKLVTGRVETVVVEEDSGQFLVIIAEPSDAMIFIDDVFAKTGEYQAKHKPGKYRYRIEAPLFHPEVGIAEIRDQKIELRVSLKPAYGFLEVNTLPEIDARVIIEGDNNIYTSPYKSGKMKSGEYNVRVNKDMYQQTISKVVIKDNETTTLNVTMPPNFANVTVNAPVNAKIFINNELKGNGSWQGRLNPALYTFSSTLESHNEAVQNLDLKAGDVKTISLNPTPILGSIDIITTPIGASLFINGKSYGTTPVTVKDLLIGEYNIQLIKQGYDNINKMFTVLQGSKNVIEESMNVSRVVSAVQEQRAADNRAAGKVTQNKPPGGTSYESTLSNFDLRKKFKKHKTLQSAWGVSTLLSAGTGVYTMIKANKLYDDYQNASYGSQINIREEIESLDKITPVAFGVAGLCSLNYLIQSIKKSKVKKSLDIKAVYIDNGFGMMLTMNF